MANVPDTIVVKRDRNLDGRAHEVWIRRGLFLILPLITSLALLNVCGQRPDTLTAAAPRADLELYAPSRVRSGVIFQARFTIRPEQTLKKATLVLDPGWLESMTVNTIEPSPSTESSKHGKLEVDLGRIDAGSPYVLFVYFQVNPTNVGSRSADVTLRDGNEEIAQVSHSITVYP